MPYYFMRDTPLQALEQLMMSQPGQKPRGGGIYRSPFHYTPKDVACEYCQNYDRKHPCRLCECTCLEERIEAGVLEMNEFVRDCFAPSTRLRLFLEWGITFEEPYIVPERADRAVAYANREDLERNLPQSNKAENADMRGAYAVSGRGGIAHEPAVDKPRRRGGKQMKTYGEEDL